MAGPARVRRPRRTPTPGSYWARTQPWLPGRSGRRPHRRAAPTSPPTACPASTSDHGQLRDPANQVLRPHPPPPVPTSRSSPPATASPAPTPPAPGYRPGRRRRPDQRTDAALTAVWDVRLPASPPATPAPPWPATSPAASRAVLAATATPADRATAARPNWTASTDAAAMLAAGAAIVTDRRPARPRLRTGPAPRCARAANSGWDDALAVVWKHSAAPRCLDAVGRRRPTSKPSGATDADSRPRAPASTGSPPTSGSQHTLIDANRAVASPVAARHRQPLPPATAATRRRRDHRSRPASPHDSPDAAPDTADTPHRPRRPGVPAAPGIGRSQRRAGGRRRPPPPPSPTGRRR